MLVQVKSFTASMAPEGVYGSVRVPVPSLLTACLTTTVSWGPSFSPTILKVPVRSAPVPFAATEKVRVFSWTALVEASVIQSGRSLTV